MTQVCRVVRGAACAGSAPEYRQVLQEHSDQREVDEGLSGLLTVPELKGHVGVVGVPARRSLGNGELDCPVAALVGLGIEVEMLTRREDHMNPDTQLGIEAGLHVKVVPGSLPDGVIPEG